MAEQPTDEPTQKTRPKKGEPVDIPIPSLGQIARDFDKIALADNNDEDNDEVRSSHFAC